MSDEIVGASSASSNTDASAGAAVATPASAIASPAAGTADASTQSQGPIPFDRHKAILDGAYHERDDARQALDTFKQQYQWAAQVNPAEFQQLQRWAQAYQENPGQWYAQTTAELKQQYPHLFASDTQPPAIEPDIPVMDAQGHVVSQAFSADKVKALLQQAIADAVGPLQRTQQQQQARETAAQAQAEVNRNVSALWERAIKWHGFMEHKDSIAKAYDAHPDWTLHDAYIDVLQREILPSADQTSQTKLLDSLKTQATGATVHPSGTPGEGIPKFKNFAEASRWFNDHPAEAEAMASR